MTEYPTTVVVVAPTRGELTHQLLARATSAQIVRHPVHDMDRLLMAYAYAVDAVPLSLTATLALSLLDHLLVWLRLSDDGCEYATPTGDGLALLAAWDAELLGEAA